MRIYACSDLHGHMNLYKQIKEYLKPSDKVYYLGDASDRGPQSWELIKTIFYDNQFVYIKGNHEDMLVNAAKDFLNPNRCWGSRDYALLVRNGGERTFDGWEQEKDREKWVERLDALPVLTTYENKDEKTMFLSHAGFTPRWVPEEIQKLSKKTFLKPADYDLVWDRDHIYDDWDNEHFSDYLVVHGHTPMANLHYLLGNSMDNFELGVYCYCDNHKVCIDCGTYRTGAACLLDLDTMENKIFVINAER